MNKKAFLVITIFLMAVTGCTAQSPPAFDPEILPSPTTTEVDPAFIPALPPLTEIDSDEPASENTQPGPTENSPSWEERRQEAKNKEKAQIIPSKDWPLYADEIGVPYSNIYTAVENHRQIIRNQGLKVDDFHFNVAVEGDDWVIVVRNKKTDVIYWAVDIKDQNSFNSRPDQKIGNGVLKPIRSPQHGEKIVFVISNNEVFAFYENGEGRKTAVFNQETGRVTRWEDTPYWKGIEALKEVVGVQFPVTDEVNRIAYDEQGNILAKLEEGRERWVYTQEGLDAIVPSEQEIKKFFDAHVDMRRYTTTDNIVFKDEGDIKAIGSINVIISGSPILAEFPDKELVLDNGQSMGNVYVLTPSVAKWKGKGGEEKYYHLFFNSGIDNFSVISLGPGVNKTLELGSEKIQKLFEVGGTRKINSYVGYNYNDVPPGSTYEDLKRLKKIMETAYPGIFPMTDLFGSSSYDMLMNHVKLGKGVDGSIIIGPTNGVDKY
jgi:hypothetical protein